MAIAILAQIALASAPPPEDAGCAAQVRTGMDQASYDRVQAEQDAADYRLVRELVDDNAGQPRFAALWVHDGGPQQVSRGALGIDPFYFASLEMIGREYRLVDLTVTVVAGSPYLSALWTRGRDLQQRVDYKLGERDLRKMLHQAGKRTLAIAPYRIAGKLTFAALFDVATGLEPSARTGLSHGALLKVDRLMAARGYMLQRVSAQPGRQDRFTAVWRRADTLPRCEAAIRRFAPVGAPPG